MNKALEAEYKSIEDDLESGHISMKEYRKEIYDLESSYRGEAECAAEEAYENEMARW